MKAIKYFAFAVMLAGFSITASAQDGTKADVDAVKKLISSKPADLDKQLKAFYSKNKKNAENLVAFGRAFYEAKDTARARQYAEYARTASKNKYAPAYLLLGDIAALGDDGGKAASYYDQAVYYDPQNPEGYKKYAMVYRKIDPAGAAAKLDDMKRNCPNENVDAFKGHMYYLSKKFADAFDAYKNVPKEQLDKMGLIEYASAAYFSNHRAEGRDIAVYGLQKEPRNSTLNRLAMFCSTELEKYDDAILYADRLFNQSDSTVASYMDYVYYGNALNGAKQHEKAIEQFKKALEMEFDNNDKKAGVYQTLANAYKGLGDYTNAIQYYELFIKEVSSTTANDRHGLAQLYIQYANTLEGSAKNEQFLKADNIYADMATKYTNIDDFIAFQRAHIGLFMDPEYKQGLANPHYAKLVEVISAKSEKSATDNKRLIESCGYFINYYVHVNQDFAKAKEYAAILLQVDPNNESAKAVMELK